MHLPYVMRVRGDCDRDHMCRHDPRQPRNEAGSRVGLERLLKGFDGINLDQGRAQDANKSKKAGPIESDRPLNLILAVTYVPASFPAQYHRPSKA